jgi:hypothetical protein
MSLVSHITHNIYSVAGKRSKYKNNTAQKKSRDVTICIAVTTTIVLLVILSSSVSNAFSQTYPFIASTRGSYNRDTGNVNHQPKLDSALSILHTSNCPSELAIYVHGIWASKKDAEEQTQRVLLSLKKEGYSIPVIGFSWDSDTAFSLYDTDLSQQGWAIGKIIANKNGPSLAKFILGFKNECPGDKVRIIAHSLGSRVTLSAIQYLYDFNRTDGNGTAPSGKAITSVHLLGAAVDKGQLSLKQTDCISNSPPLQCSGTAVYSVVKYFYNLFDPEDNMLATDTRSICYYLYCAPMTFASPYQLSEHHNALGAYGRGHMSIPSNYREYDVLSRIIYDDDADKKNGCDIYPGFCTITKPGDNHLGYMGFRSNTNHETLNSSGAIATVVLNWRNES